MPFIGSIRKLLYTWRGNNKYARFEELSKNLYLPYEELKKRQFADLIKLVNHAYNTTEYYKDMFTSLNIKPADIRTFEDYAKLPVLTKSIMLENIERMCSTSTPKEQRILNSSGGTTGNPGRFYQDSHVFKEMDAHYLLILSLAGWTPDDMIFSLWGNANDFLNSKKIGGLRPWLAGTQTCNAFKYGENDMEMWAQGLKRYNKVFLYGYACAITDFAKYCREKKHNINNIGGVVTTAEQLFPHYREIIESTFNCKVYDQYGAREVPGVASQCEHGNMHIFTTSAYVEFMQLEQKGVHDDLGEAQKLIITNLNNYTMPLLRYEIGDYATPIQSEIPCACGRHTDLMQMNVGRIGGTLLLPNGEKLYSSLFVRQICAIPGMQNFQFRQKELGNIDLYIVKNKEYTSESEKKFKDFTETFPVTICPGTTLNIHYVDDIPKTQGGKLRQVVCEVEK